MNYRISSIYNQKLNEIQSRVPVRICRERSDKSNNAESFDEQLGYEMNKNANYLKNTSKRYTAQKTPNAYVGTISRLSDKYGVNSSLVNAVIKAESGFNPSAVSKAGAIGLMQLMPATAQGLGVSDPYNPEQNIDGGIRYIKQMLDRYDGDIKMALAAYNAGSGTLNKLKITDLDDNSQFSRLPSETKNYINTILNYMDF